MSAYDTKLNKRLTLDVLSMTILSQTFLVREQRVEQKGEVDTSAELVPLNSGFVAIGPGQTMVTSMPF